MTLTPVWGILAIFLLCPLLGGLPLVYWITYGLTGRKLNQLGTQNVGVSAAFYHGGQVAGILAVLSEALKGIAAVLLARTFFPTEPAWEIVALIALVLGRYWMGQGAGTTNVVWGFIVHDWMTAFLVALIGGVGFTILRERRLGRMGVLALIPAITALRHPQDGLLIGATLTLSLLMGWIFQKMPEDLELPSSAAHRESRQVFQFFRGDRAILSLDRSVEARKVGGKAAVLSRLKRWGYPVPMGWILPPGDDPAPLIEALQPSDEQPLIVRSSAIGEDASTASAAGQYESFATITNKASLEQAIAQCQASYNRPHAVRYRRDRQLTDESMAVLVQVQVRGVFSGVAFSRDPITRYGDAVVIEALPGDATRVVSGQVTPEQYRVRLRADEVNDDGGPSDQDADWVLPDSTQLAVEGQGDVPPRLIQQVAYLARHIEGRYHGVPQDIEWTYDGQQLWILQSRPITTLLPIWTRKIASEVIPGFIRPLTWSINQPLTCGVWGEIFTIVLGDRARNLDFSHTASLHHSAAYFNASLLGKIFRRMGLPPESLEFLTRGAKFSKPSLVVTLRNLPGLLRLVGRELNLEQDFEQEYHRHLAPGLADLSDDQLDDLSNQDLIDRVDYILDLLERTTYYNILVPLSLALRQAILGVKDSYLDSSRLPEVASLRSLKELAIDCRPFLPTSLPNDARSSTIFATLSENPDGQNVVEQFDKFLDRYGYLSEVATDIAVPTWKEDPRPVRKLFAQFLTTPDLKVPKSQQSSSSSWKVQQVQKRLDLKGQIADVYDRLLAELRWSFVALEQDWLSREILDQAGDVFFLTLDEIRQAVSPSDSSNSDSPNSVFINQMSDLIAARRSQWEADRQITPIPSLVYGNEPPARQYLLCRTEATADKPHQSLRGIGASPGIVEGEILILQGLQGAPDVSKNTVLVLPYTDSGWAPLLAQAGGLIAETGGRLSHGAIVAREYGIPAVMDVSDASQRLRNGQQVRIDGAQGIIEIL
ncbi:MAG: glycerol-3-phosphate acyltransferase [Elainellaceae cyanobacterium]